MTDTTRTTDPRQTIRAYFDAVDANDFVRVLEQFDPDAVYERPGYPPLEGRDRLRTFFIEERIIATGRHDIEGIVVDGEQVTAWGSFTGTSRTGGALNEGWCDVYQFHDGRIARRRTYFYRPAV
jgi:ketosteroid isomerase-like protein